MNNWVVYLAGVAWSSVFGLSFLVTQGALEAFSPFELLFLRFTLATAILSVLARLGFVKLGFRGKPKAVLFLLCLFQPVIYFACETFGLERTASSTAGLILGAMPAAVALLSVPMLKERLSRRQAAGLALSLAGVASIVLSGAAGGGRDSALGIVLISGALVSAAFYNIYSRRASSSYSPAETTFAMMASGALAFGLLALGERLASGRAGGGAPGLLARATPAAWGAVAYLGVLSSVLAFFLVNFTLSRLKASQSAVFGCLTTLVSLVAGIALRGEYAGPFQLAGAAMILAGVLATNLGAAGGAGPAQGRGRNRSAE
jgi:drug/metabolite transporter (DMT)-like permease